ncbi:MAG: rsmC [Myxococcales bacterium]|nr:rsmC [Myxococcales bacterium]
MSDDGADEARALLALGLELQAAGYRFTTVTPATHARINARPANAEARDLAGVFGWSRPFRRALLPSQLSALLAEAGALVDAGGGLSRSAVRFSSLGERLYVHSAFPTDAADAVFFGPDTYRFVAALSRRARPAKLAVDLGCGSGAGGLSLDGRVERLILTDINPRALRLARVNAALAGAAGVDFALGDLYAAVDGDVDLVVANPPYIADLAGRAYRDGGGAVGTGLSRRIVAEGLPRLRRGGQLILYTGAPVRDGEDLLRQELTPLVDPAAYHMEYEELDPDVFGEELEQPSYADIDRIAVVCLEITRG